MLSGHFLKYMFQNYSLFGFFLLTAEDDCESDTGESKGSGITTKNAAAKGCRENLTKNAIVGDCLYNPTNQLQIQVKYTLSIGLIVIILVILIDSFEVT